MTHSDYYDLHRLQNQRPSVPTTLNKNTRLETYPSWRDERYSQGQTHTVFGKDPGEELTHKGLSYDYSDRLWQWDYKKSQEAFEVAKASGKPKNSCRYYEAYLSHYFDKPIVIEHIVVGINVSNGYPYLVFGYRAAEQEAQ